MIGQKKCPWGGDSGTCFLSLPMCLSTCIILFFLLINTLLASLLSIFVEILFCTAQEPRPGHWPLVCMSLATQSCPTLCDPIDYSPPGFSLCGDFPGKNTGVGCQVLLQGIFPTQGLNPGLQHCRQILYYLSHQGSLTSSLVARIWCFHHPDPASISGWEPKSYFKLLKVKATQGHSWHQELVLLALLLKWLHFCFTPVLLPGKSHGPRSLVGFSPWGLEESDTTERLHFYFSLSCTGEGNGNPLQCSCLGNPRDGRAWWAAIYGVAQSRTRLKWLSSSSSSNPLIEMITFLFHSIPKGWILKI